MRTLPSQAPAASRPVASATPRPASVLSAGASRTPAFRALFPQLRLLGRVLKELLPQTPRWPMPSGPRQGDGIIRDKFSPPTGRGIPIRICVAGPSRGPGPLRLKPWLGSLLKPWCGNVLKPWLHQPHVFKPRPGDPGTGPGARVRACGAGVPIRIC